MKRKRKKLLALVTALSLVMSLLGVTAFAVRRTHPPMRMTGSTAPPAMGAAQSRRVRPAPTAMVPAKSPAPGLSPAS